jgi:adenylate kinase
VIIGLMADRLGEADARKGFVLDGYPRTVPQAEALDRFLDEHGLSLDRVVVFDLPDDVLVERLTGRRVCRDCGRNYHVTFSPSRRGGRCEHCDGELYRRRDDEPDTVRRRLAVYVRDTRPLVDHYRRQGRVETVSAVGTVDAVAAAILQVTEGGR